MEPATVEPFGDGPRCGPGFLSIDELEKGAKLFHHPWTREETSWETLGDVLGTGDEPSSDGLQPSRDGLQPSVMETSWRLWREAQVMQDFRQWQVNGCLCSKLRKFLRMKHNCEDSE